MEVNKWLDELLNIRSKTSDVVKVYEDVIDEESAYNQLSSLLAGSNETIGKLNEYIKANHERSEPYDKSLLNTAENFYIHEGKAYYLTREQWAQVQGIINDCKNLKVLEKTLSKSPNISYKFKAIYVEAYNEIKKMKETVYTHMLKSLPEREVTLIITKVLNNLLIEHFKQAEVSELLFPYKKVCILLGIELCNLYITNKVTYAAESEGYEEDVTSKGDKIIRPKYKMEADKYKEIKKSLVKKIKDKTISIVDYKELNIEINYDKEFEYMNAAILIESLNSKEEESGNTLSIEDYNEKVKAQEITASMAYNKGELVTNKLIESKLFIIEQDARKVPYLRLSNKLEIEVIASACFTKPIVLNERIITKSDHKVLENVTFTLKTKSSLIKTDSNVRLYASAELEETLSHMSEYKVPQNNFKSFIQYIEEILDIPFDKENTSIQSFLWVYTLDFKEIRKNTAHSEVIERLMRFGIKLDILFDKDLLKACKCSPSCLRMYNVIISYKYYLKGLLNDVAIYSKLNYFYLPRSITSTGRTLTIPYFLNLQNFKLTKAFCIMHKVSSINEDNYEQVKGSIMKEIKTDSLREELKNISYEKYDEKTKELMRTYRKDFLRLNEKYSDYPKESTYREQIDWLAINCKKPREIFYAQLLYNSKYKEPNLSLIYELDATSSGLQLIGMLMRDQDNCILSNVIGTKYVDIYTTYVQEKNIAISKVKDYVTESYSSIGISMDNVIKDKTSDLVDMTNFKKVVIKFINTKKEEIIPLISKLFTIIKTQSKEELAYLNQELPYECSWVIDSSQSKVKDTEYKQALRYIETISNRMGSKVKTKALENLIYIHAMSSYFISLRDNEWLLELKSLNKRNLCKKCIMALPYSMGSSGRIDALTTYFIDEANLNGYDINVGSLSPIIRILDRYFSVFERTHLSKASEFLKIIKKYIDYHIPSNKIGSVALHENMMIKTRYLTWIFMPYETVMKRLTLSKHQLSIYRHTGFLHKGIALTSFSAMYIHSADANIVHRYLELTRNIGKNLSRKLGIKVGVFTNHDNFGISKELSPFLKIILKECYNSFADSKYLDTINVTTTKANIERIKATNKKIYCTNDNFVKH